MTGTKIFKNGGYFDDEFDCYNHKKGTATTKFGHRVIFDDYIDNGYNIGPNGLCEDIDPSCHKFSLLYDNAYIIESVKSIYSKLNKSIRKCVDLKICTLSYTGKHFYTQGYYEC